MAETPWNGNSLSYGALIGIINGLIAFVLIVVFVFINKRNGRAITSIEHDLNPTKMEPS